MTRILTPTALTELGHFLETFVVERDDGAVLAFEVKAAGRVPGREFGPLRKLRDAVGDAFVAGVVLDTGTHSYAVEERLHAMPIDRLWLPPGGDRVGPIESG